MSGLHTEFVSDAHAYTRSRTPWLIGENRAAHGETTTGLRFGWRLFHYIAGGGMRSFGRSVGQEERDARQNRFLVWTGILFATWLALLVI